MAKKIGILGIALGALLLVATPDSARATETQQIEQLRTMLDEQDALDSKDAAKKDRQLARQWLQEAEILVANGKRDAAARRLRRAEFAVELVTALVAGAVVRQKAEEQEAAAHTAPEQVEALQDEVDALRRRLSELQAELKQLEQAQ